MHNFFARNLTNFRLSFLQAEIGNTGPWNIKQSPTATFVRRSSELRYCIEDFCLWHNNPSRAYSVSLLKFLRHTKLDTHKHTHTHTHTHGRTTLSERSARRKGRYPHNTQQTNYTYVMPSVGLEHAIPTMKRLLNYA